MVMHQNDRGKLMSEWGALFATLQIRETAEKGDLQRGVPPPNWDFVEAIIQGGLDDSKLATSKLKDLLHKSRSKLSPLSDPLLVDLGMHRWLLAEREEAYSDWLAWIIEQIPRAETMLRLLNVQDQELLKFCSGQKIRVRREVVINAGRLDLVLEVGHDALLLIEVKMVPADIADTEKQKGYCNWFYSQPHKFKPTPILLVLEAQKENYHGFVPLRWRQLCVGLRRLFPEIYRHLEYTKAALVLSFIGAVEANLLRLATPYDPVKRALLFGRTIDHIEESLTNREPT